MDAFVVLEDNSRDFKSLAYILADAEPLARIEHTDDISTLYQILSRTAAVSRTMVFSDISLEGDHDRRGLDCLADLAMSFPIVPFTIITGHFADNIAAVAHDYFHDPQIVTVLDKLTYTDSEVADAVIRGDDFVESTTQRMAAERALLARAAVQPDDSWLTDYTDKTAVTGARRPSRRHQDRMVIQAVFGEVYKMIRLGDAAVDDLVEMLSTNPGWFHDAVRGLRSFDTGTPAERGQKKIESCDGIWEIRGGRDLRIYFRLDDQFAAVLRIAPKTEQNRVIKWLKSM